ncbi:MAG: hypothetical protein KDD73_01475 [Anaerolineales bacterium]|nr:hypothetical protein [Anaerolineales bacterium]MCB9127398.1 hypothetical protein [Ardenticatenales bacterium]
MTGSARPSWLGCLGGIVAAALLVALLFVFSSRASTLTKSVGVVLSFIPTQLGLMDDVDPADIYTIPSPPSGEAAAPVDIRRSGQYFLYTDDTTTLLNLTNAQIPWLRVTSTTTGQELPIQLVQRGQMPYDTVHAPGRPIFTFNVPSPDRYDVYIPRLAPRDSFAIVPDNVTGQEVKIWLLYALQIGLVLSPLLWRRLRSQRQRLTRVAANREDKLEKMDQMRAHRRNKGERR